MTLKSEIERKFKIEDLANASSGQREELLRAAAAGGLTKEEFLEVLKIVPDIVKFIPEFLQSICSVMQAVGEGQKATLKVVSGLIENLKVLSERAETEDLRREISDKTIEAIKLLKEINEDNNENSRSIFMIGIFGLLGLVALLTGKVTPSQAAKIASGKII